MGPDKYDVINVSGVEGWLGLVGVDMFGFEIIHKNVSKGWGYLSAHCCAPHLEEVFVVELEIVQAKHQVEEFCDCSVCGQKVWGTVGIKFASCRFYAFIVGDVSIERGHIHGR